jgi:hypothetical protein
MVKHAAGAAAINSSGLATFSIKTIHRAGTG